MEESPNRKWTSSFLRNNLKPNCKRYSLFTLLCCASLVHCSGPSRISVEPDGGYSGIVFKISDEVNEESCADILTNLQVRHKLLTLKITRLSVFPRNTVNLCNNKDPLCLVITSVICMS